MEKKYLLLLIIVILAAILRFWQLGIIPTGVTHDELGYIYNSYSIAKTGRNVFGEFLPFLTWMNQGGWPFLPVPIYFSIPFFWLFDLSATVGRLPSAILGVADVLLIYILIKQIFNKTSLALLSAFFLAISPWHLHFSRSAYDPNFALFFYLLGTVIFISEIKSKRMPIFSAVFFWLAIFSYRAMNIIFFPLVIILIWYGIVALKAKYKQLIILLLGVFVVVVSLVFAITTNGKRYISEASIVNQAKMQEELDNQIRDAQGPLFLRRIFLNKPVYIVSKLRENYVKAYSPEFLFLYTDPSKIYSIWSRGRIYFIDIIFIVLGTVYLYAINKKGAFFITSLLLIGGLPGMIGGTPYSARNLLLSAVFPVFSAGGVFFLLNNPFLIKFKTIIIATVILTYVYLLGSYLFDYYGRYALYGGEAWVKSLKDLSLLITENKKTHDKIIVGQTSFGDLIQYAFYTKIKPSDVQNAWQKRQADIGESFSIDNVIFTTRCLDNKTGGLPALREYKSVLYVVRDDCAKMATPSALIKDYPGNTIWKIYNIGHLL
ncbi:MAG: glycosyltransferase family 39 protein [Patescibacteria group bacterium]